jgi:hypothetical protein
VEFIMKLPVAASLIATAFFCVPAHSQFDSIAENYNDLAVSNTSIAIQSAMNNIAMQETLRRPNAARSGRLVAPRGAASNSTVTQQDLMVLRYSPSVTRRRANLMALANRLRGKDPAGSAELAKVFNNMDVIAEIGKGIAPYGVRTDNVADAYAVWWMQTWSAVHGDTRQSSYAQIQAVKRQATSAMLALPMMRTMNDAMKQEYAETMLVQMWLMSDFAQQHKNDRGLMAKLAASAREGALKYGLDLDAMTLTEQGFVPSGKTGAADLDRGREPGAPEQALAANATPAPKAANDTSPPYILLAAAGGAGLGGVFLLGKLVGKRG